ncbi:MAG: argininosuccinate lyase [Cytophagales bacterium]|nr:argininosuccinate lyase [Cytophagales bacterium]
MTLWQKDKSALQEVTDFTTGDDRAMDRYLARFDVLGSLAHIRMLESIGLLSDEERTALSAELKKIYATIEAGTFEIQEGVEDIHSQVELMLTQTLGESGKKIHSGRSRNDQVLVDIKLFIRHEIQKLAESVKQLFDLLLAKSEEHKDKLLPGYTHLQLAMPSSFGLWFGAYAESLVDDVITLHAAYQVANKNPLGSGAGYGSSFPLDRKMTTELLGFDDLNYNVVYAQMGRGKTEKITSAALGNVAATLSRLAMDACLYLNPHFGFIKFPDELTTGSSIMPHKKNPDVFELVRARCNSIQALANEITLVTANLPSGYHRDLQVLKEKLFPAFQTLRSCLQMTHQMISHMEVKANILEDNQYQFLFSVEEVNKLVLQGVPFRDAYKQIGRNIEKGTFTYSKKLNHTHEGSMGNLCTAEIKAMMDTQLQSFQFQKAQDALARLLK